MSHRVRRQLVKKVEVGVCGETINKHSSSSTDRVSTTGANLTDKRWVEFKAEFIRINKEVGGLVVFILTPLTSLEEEEAAEEEEEA